MSEVGVHRAANDLAANATELLYSVAERNDLGGTHKCEVQGVEEEDQIFSWRRNSLISQAAVRESASSSSNA